MSIHIAPNKVYASNPIPRIVKSSSKNFCSKNTPLSRAIGTHLHVTLRQWLHVRSIFHINRLHPLILPRRVHLHLREAVTGMKNGQGQRSNGDHCAIERNKVRFILHDWAAPPFRHLRNAVHASRENGEIRKNDGAREELEAPRVHEPVRRSRQAVAVLEDSSAV